MDEKIDLAQVVRRAKERMRKVKDGITTLTVRNSTMEFIRQLKEVLQEEGVPVNSYADALLFMLDNYDGEPRTVPRPPPSREFWAGQFESLRTELAEQRKELEDVKSALNRVVTHMERIEEAISRGVTLRSPLPAPPGEKGLKKLFKARPVEHPIFQDNPYYQVFRERWTRSPSP